MQLVFRPIVVWPGKLATFRKSSPFRAGWSDTLKLLERELDHLGAHAAVCQVALREKQIDITGLPRRDAVFEHPGVIVAFESKHGALSYPCDTFEDWRANVRAIALGLEHLRAVDRFGITHTGEQYRGWTALPAPKAAMTREDARAFLRQFMPSGTTPSQEDTFLSLAYRNAAMKLHPDRGGDPEQFKKLQQAKEALKL